MLLILISLTLLGLSFLLHLPQALTSGSLILHHGCLRLLPDHVENLKSLEALVCGKNLENLELKHLLIQTSLIHIFIVSGTQFLFLHKILATAFRSRWIPFFPLAVYAMATLCQPPAVRSFLFLLLVEASRRWKLFPSAVVLIFASAALSLAIFPLWIESRSMLMSLMAALVIAFMSEVWGRERETLPAIFAIQSTVYFFMAFCLWGFSNLHPLGILLNILLAPFIGLFLFPVALLTVVVPWCGFLFDGLMRALIFLLSKTEEVLTLPSLATPLGVAWQWALFFGLLSACYVFLVSKRRRKIYEC